MNQSRNLLQWEFKMADDIETLQHIAKKYLILRDGERTNLPTVTMNEGGSIPRKLVWCKETTVGVSTYTEFGEIRAKINWKITLEWVGDGLFQQTVIAWLEPIGDTDICSSCGDGGLPQLSSGANVYTYDRCPNIDELSSFLQSLRSDIISAAKNVQRSITKVYTALASSECTDKICQLSLGDLAEFIPGRASEKAVRQTIPSERTDGSTGVLSAGIEEFVAAAVAEGTPSKDVPVEVSVAVVTPTPAEPPIGAETKEVAHVSST